MCITATFLPMFLVCLDTVSCQIKPKDVNKRWPKIKLYIYNKKVIWVKKHPGKADECRPESCRSSLSGLGGCRVQSQGILTDGVIFRQSCQFLHQLLKVLPITGWFILLEHDSTTFSLTSNTDVLKALMTNLAI